MGRTFCSLNWYHLQIAQHVCGASPGNFAGTTSHVVGIYGRRVETRLTCNPFLRFCSSVSCDSSGTSEYARTSASVEERCFCTTTVRKLRRQPFRLRVPVTRTCRYPVIYRSRRNSLQRELEPRCRKDHHRSCVLRYCLSDPKRVGDSCPRVKAEFSGHNELTSAVPSNQRAVWSAPVQMSPKRIVRQGPRCFKQRTQHLVSEST